MQDREGAAKPAVVAICGTDLPGVTARMLEAFLAPLRETAQVELIHLPSASPHFCSGCKRCFNESEAACPHHAAIGPIREALFAATLIVFAYPVYVGRAPGAVKALLDHFGVNWMAHRPEPRMFTKRAVILTQATGSPNGAAQRDVATSLRWMGLGRVRSSGFRLVDGGTWDELSDRRRQRLLTRMDRLGRRYAASLNEADGPTLGTRLRFRLMRSMMKARQKKDGATPSADVRHWRAQGWLH